LDYLLTLIEEGEEVCRNTYGTDEHDVLLARQALQDENLLELASIELDRRAPVEPV
jgi:hypothetical protein